MAIKNRELQFIIAETESCIIKEAQSKGITLNEIANDLELIFGKMGEVHISYNTSEYSCYIVYQWDEECETFEFLDSSFEKSAKSCKK